MTYSMEWLEMQLAARRRLQARQTLELAQAIVAGMGDSDAWGKIQQRLINDAKAGL